MFLGEYTHIIDDKGRLTIPAKFRSDLAAGLILTRGFDENLMIYTITGWKELAERIVARSLTDSRIRDFRRRIFSGATDLSPDRQGRILIPPYLRDFAKMESEVIIAGMYEYIEIWSIPAWESKRTMIEGSTDQSYWNDLVI